MGKKNECYQCKGKFGLTRNYHLGKSFCRIKCMDDYKRGKPPNQYELPLDKPPDELVQLLKYP